MTRTELTDEIAGMVEQSGLSLSDKVYAMRAALTRIQMNVSPQKIEERSMRGADDDLEKVRRWLS